MDKIMHLPLFSLCLTLGAYLIGMWCQKKIKFPLCNPFFIAVVLVGAFLLLSRLPMAEYQGSMDKINWLLTPATVALAVPLYEQVKVLKKNLPAIVAGIAAGAVSSLILVFSMSLLFMLPRELTVSLLPKSITTAIGMVLAEQNGGIAALTAGAIAITGLTGVLLGPMFCKLFRLTDPISQGVAYGTASHAIGTSQAVKLHPVCGAASSLSLVVAGLLTAALFPFVCMLL